MFGKRCQLCGGKLVNNRCTLCGLDNLKTDANYKLNQNSCDGRPLIHVHSEKPVVKKTNKTNRNIKTIRAGKEGTKKWAVIVAVIIFIISVFQELDFPQMFAENISDTFRKLSNGIQEEEPDWYAYAERELSDTGEDYEAELESNLYRRCTYSRGNLYYRGKCERNLRWILSRKMKKTVSMGEKVSMMMKKEIIEDIRCYAGAKLSARGKMRIVSSNAQTADMMALDNPLTESVIVKDGDIAGETFPAGTYDVVMEEGDTSFAYIVPGTVMDDPEDEYEGVTERFWIDTYSGTFVRRNLYLPEGTEIQVDEGEVTLIPSEKIPESYEGYYYIFE